MARTVVTVVGMADRCSGKSGKTGKDYDFCEIAVSFVNQWNRNAVAIANLDGPVLDKLGVKVGDQYEASVITVNGKTYVDLIDEVF